jgi:hypothetical protein
MTAKQLANHIKKLGGQSPLADELLRSLLDRELLKSPWYETQQEHWLGWLKGYPGPGHYGRMQHNRDARFIYNHIVCPPMVLWLPEALCVPKSLIKRAFNATLVLPTLASQSGAIRRVLPWQLVEEHLLSQKP